jgi:interferon gamma-inducible protein 30
MTLCSKRTNYPHSFGKYKSQINLTKHIKTLFLVFLLKMSASRTILFISTVCLLTVLAASAGSDDKVRYDLYVESLCPDCIGFIEESIAPALEIPGFLDIAELNFIPYGNAKRADNGTITCQHGVPECYGNKIEACGEIYIPAKMDYFNFIICVESNINRFAPAFDTVVAGCVEALALPSDTLTSIITCANDTLGDDLNAYNGELTDALIPKHSYVPWVVINGVHNDSEEESAIDNILSFTC